MNTVTVAALVVLSGLLAACGQGEPGTPSNHPLVWAVGLSVSFCLLAAGYALISGVARRHERREERRDRREERRD